MNTIKHVEANEPYSSVRISKRCRRLSKKASQLQRKADREMKKLEREAYAWASLGH